MAPDRASRSTNVREGEKLFQKRPMLQPDPGGVLCYHSRLPDPLPSRKSQVGFPLFTIVMLILKGVKVRVGLELKERVRWPKELEEAGRQLARERLESSSPEQVVEEAEVADQIVQIECEHCGVRYPEGTVKCPICDGSP
jgi:hypothetical protein